MLRSKRERIHTQEELDNQKCLYKEQLAIEKIDVNNFDAVRLALDTLNQKITDHNAKYGNPLAHVSANKLYSYSAGGKFVISTECAHQENPTFKGIIVSSFEDKDFLKSEGCKWNGRAWICNPEKVEDLQLAISPDLKK
jgi:hypothetical protein